MDEGDSNRLSLLCIFMPHNVNVIIGGMQLLTSPQPLPQRNVTAVRTLHDSLKSFTQYHASERQ